MISVETLLLALLRHDPTTATLLGEKGLTYQLVREAAEKGLSSLYLEFALPRPRAYTRRIHR